MVALVVLGMAFAVFVSVGAWLTTVAMQQISNGYDEAIRVNRETRYLLTARVTTLENRLQTSNWQEFATLQQVPAETEKVGWSEQVEAEAKQAGIYTNEQLEHLRKIIEDGSSPDQHQYEDDLEGSTIG